MSGQLIFYHKVGTFSYSYEPFLLNFCDEFLSLYFCIHHIFCKLAA